MREVPVTRDVGSMDETGQTRWPAPPDVGASGLGSTWARRRRGLQIALGLIWLLDAGLQFQPYMFGKKFATQILAPSALGNPGVVAHPITSVANLLGHHIAAYNTVFALIQLAIAVGILWRPTVKPALVLSIVWSLAVWWFGEGLGGIFTGLTPVMGYPGAVLLYALIALLVWPSNHAGPSVALSGPLRETTPRVLWAILWVSFTRFLLLSANRSPEGLNQAVSAMSPGEPRWVKSINSGLADAVAHHGTEVSLALALLCLFVAFAVFRPSLLRPALIVASVMAVGFWVAQDFGGVVTGQGTDPNTGPLLILLAATFWPIMTAKVHPTNWEPA